jgi:hypothetical protein
MSEDYSKADTDFSTADTQGGPPPIPTGTITELQLLIKAGLSGDDGMLTMARDGLSAHLECLFVVLAPAEFSGRSFKQRFMQQSPNSEKHGDSIAIARKTLRAIIQSARGIPSPFIEVNGVRVDAGKDEFTDDNATRAAKIKAREDFKLKMTLQNGYRDLDGLCFLAGLGIEKGTDGYPDKNRIGFVLTPDRRDWRQVAQAPLPVRANPTAGAPAPVRPATASAPAAAQTGVVIKRPSWLPNSAAS